MTPRVVDVLVPPSGPDPGPRALRALLEIVRTAAAAGSDDDQESGS